jgi:hypothetical protein
MKKVGFSMLFITICVMLIAESGEEMLKRAISTNPTNKWGNDKQKGEWTNGSNMSACLFSNGSMYLGNFIGNKRNGRAIYIASEGYEINNCPNAKYYVGNWSNDTKSGIGSCYDASGKLIYDGEFKDDKPSGTYPTTGSYASYKFQTIDYTSGDKYIGETNNGKRHGYGVYAWKDGRIWIGIWEDGVRAGRGIDIASNGSLVTGSWDNDTRSSSIAVASGSSGSSGSSVSGVASNSSPSSSEGGPPVTVVNTTGKNIRKVVFQYVKERKEDGNITIRETTKQTTTINPYLGTGQTTAINLPEPVSVLNKYDIEVEYTDGTTSNLSNVSVSANARIGLGGSSSSSGSSSSGSNGYASGSSSYNQISQICSVCGGTGRTQCISCFGTGWLRMPMGSQLCFFCNGLGYSTCLGCSGRGTLTITMSPPPPPPVLPPVSSITPVMPYSGGGVGSSGSSGYSSSSGSSSSGYSSSRGTPCSSCKTTGLCNACKGEKKLRYKDTGRYIGEYIDTIDTCAVCKGSGKCGVCYGLGYIR